MKTRAAVLRGVNDLKVEELELDPPQRNEVLVRMVACGLCHSDHHIVSGEVPAPLPMIPGHEGAGVIEAVGDGVDQVKVGDHVLTTFMPACGRCRWCAQGQSFLCDRGAGMLSGLQLDGTYRFHSHAGEDIAQICYLGAFSEHTVVPVDSVVKVPEDVNLESACLIACAVMTGWGAAVRRAQVQSGDVVVVFGIGGLGAAAIQGARLSGASTIIAVDPDPVGHKLKVAEQLGATMVINNASTGSAALVEAVHSVTNGYGADVAILTPGVNSTQIISDGYATIRKGGKLVLVGTPGMMLTEMQLPIIDLILSNKAILGCLYGEGNPHADLPRLLDLYRSGLLKVDELVTTRYQLDDIMTGYDDMNAGRNIRGVVVF